MRNKKNKSKKYKKTILNLILYIILLSILIYSGIKIFKWYKDKTNNNKKNEYEKCIDYQRPYKPCRICSQ